MQTNDYYWIRIVTLKDIIVYELLVLDRNTWNHITVVKKNDIEIKKHNFKNAMEYWKYSHDYKQTFISESNFGIR